MRISEKYSYSKYRNKESRPQGSGRVFVSPKEKFSFNPIINLPAKFWGNIGLLILIVFGLWFVFYSRFFQIKEIIIEGNSLVSSDRISKNIDLGQNIFRFNIKNTREKIIANNPLIGDVAIYRGIPNALKIVILERKPQIIWQSGDKYYLVDESGTVGREVSNSEFPDLIRIADRKNMPVHVGQHLLSESFINFSEKINRDFFSEVNIHPTGYYITETTFDPYVQTDSGFFVKFDTARDAKKQLSDLKDIIIAYRSNIHEYVDVRINGWAYYK